jgi:hypothetical protein
MSGRPLIGFLFTCARTGAWRGSVLARQLGCMQEDRMSTVVIGMDPR